MFNTNKPFLYYHFGSHDSSDYDIIVAVDSISPDIDVSHGICKEYNGYFSKIYTDKVINTNLMVIDGNTIKQVFKGTPEEVQNAIYYTYRLHKQEHDLIFSPVERDKHIKIKRVVRGILSFYSRSEHRERIKHALRSDNIIDRLDALSYIDLDKYYDFKGKKERRTDILKVLAFQFGQLFSLYDGYEPESYTKGGIMKNYPDLAPFLMRQDGDLVVLEKYLIRLIVLALVEIPKMETLGEINKK